MWPGLLCWTGTGSGVGGVAPTYNRNMFPTLSDGRFKATAQTSIGTAYSLVGSKTGDGTGVLRIAHLCGGTFLHIDVVQLEAGTVNYDRVFVAQGDTVTVEIDVTEGTIDVPSPRMMSIPVPSSGVTSDAGRIPAGCVPAATVARIQVPLNLTRE